MRSDGVIVRYDGLIATSEHMLDMRRLGNALIGFDRVATVGLIAVTEGRMPRRNERLPFNILAGEPKANCVSVLATVWNAAQQSLPFAMPILQTASTDLLWEWVSYTFKTLGGRVKEADPHFLKLMELTESIRKGELEDRENMRRFTLDVLDKVKVHAGNVAAPVGNSSNELSFVNSASGARTTLGIAEAAAVRSKEPLEVGDMEAMRIQVDGLTKHSRRASVIRLDDPDRFVLAEIRDPLFDASPNAYTDALGSDTVLAVRATPTYRAGELYRLYIMGIEPN